MTRLLIVNADDYGLTPGVSRGILRAHREGIVTSVSVLSVAPAFDSTSRELQASGGIGIGVHLAAVGEDPPLLPPSRIPSLVDARGRFPPDWRGFLRRARKIRPAELEAEFAAQIERATEAALRIDHLDSHQHLHLLPSVRGVVLRLAGRFGIRSVRVPRGGPNRPSGLAVRWLGRSLARAADRAGIVHPERSEGFDESGRMSSRRLLRTIDRLARSAARSAEILVHPGEEDDPERARYAWGYDWAGELEALCDGRVREAAARAGFRLGTHADLFAR